MTSVARIQLLAYPIADSCQVDAHFGQHLHGHALTIMDETE
jgi:hypothetical protein